MQELNQKRIEQMTELLNSSLNPTEISITDESHLHAGHAGAKSGKGHFNLVIKSEEFAGLLPLKRHRLVYEALGDMMKTDIHALKIKAGV